MARCAWLDDAVKGQIAILVRCVYSDGATMRKGLILTISVAIRQVASQHVE